MSAEQLRRRIADLMGRAQTDLAELVAIPSVADPRQYPPQECARAAQWVADAFTAVGFTGMGLHETADGRTISQDCETCHSLLAMEESDPEILRTLSP